MKNFKTKIIFGITSIFAFLFMFLGTINVPSQTVSAYKAGDVITWTTSDVQGVYAYRDNETNTLFNHHGDTKGISVSYSGGRNNQVSGLFDASIYSSAISRHRMDILFNSSDSILTFTSEDNPICKIRIVYMKKPDSNNLGDIDVNGGRWERKYINGIDQYGLDIYAVELTGPASNYVAMQSHYSAFMWQCQDISQIEFTVATPYNLTLDEGIESGYATYGGVLLTAKKPFIVRDSSNNSIVAMSSGSGEKYSAEYWGSIMNLKAEYYNGSLTVNSLNDYNFAISAGFVGKIVLGTNLELNNLTIARSVEIDLNGKILSFNSSDGNKVLTINRYCSLTFSDSSGNGKVTGFNKVNMLVLSGFNIKGGTFDFREISYNETEYAINISGGHFRLYNDWTIDNIEEFIHYYQGCHCIAVDNGNGYADVIPHVHNEYIEFKYGQDGAWERITTCVDCKRVLDYWCLDSKLMHRILEVGGENLILTWNIDNENSPSKASLNIKIDDATYDSIVDEIDDTTFDPKNYDGLRFFYHFGLEFDSIPLISLGHCGIYSASKVVNGFTFSHEFETGDEHHSWAEPVWEWYKHEYWFIATATFTCDDCGKQVELGGDFATTISTSVEKRATVEEEGTIVCTGQVKFLGETYTNVYYAVYPKIQHFPRVEPTCDADGHIEYWYDEYLGDYFDEPQLLYQTWEEYLILNGGHVWVENWKWAEDYSTSKLTINCSRCGESHEADASISIKRVEPTYEDQGKATYTARVEIAGKTFISVKEQILPVLEIQYTKVEAVPVTQFEDGNEEYYIGSNGKYYMYNYNWGYYALREVDFGEWIIHAPGREDINISGSYYYGKHIVVNCSYDEDYKAILSSNSDLSVVALNRVVLVKVVFSVNENENYSSYVTTDKGNIELSENGKIITVTDINDLSFNLSSSNDNNIYIDKITAYFVSNDSVTFTLVPAKKSTIYEQGNTQYYIGSDSRYYVLRENEYVEIAENSWILPIATIVHHIEAKAPTFTNAGWLEYFIDTENNYYIKDGDLYVLTTKSEVNLPKIPLTYHPATKPTYLVPGNKEYYTDPSGNCYVWTGRGYESRSLESLTITLTKHDAVEATDTENGNIEYYEGSDGSYYIIKNDEYVQVAYGMWIIPAEVFDAGESITLSGSSIVRGLNADVSSPWRTDIIYNDDPDNYSSLTITTKNGKILDKIIIYVTEDLYNGTSSVIVTSGNIEERSSNKVIVSGINNSTITISVPMSDGNNYYDFEVSSVDIFYLQVYTKVEAKEPTITEFGNIEYYINERGRYFLKNGNNYTEINHADIILQKVIVTHYDAVEPTYTSDGNIDYYIGSNGKYYILNENEEYEEIAKGSQLILSSGFEKFTTEDDHDGSYTYEGTYINVIANYYGEAEWGEYVRRDKPLSVKSVSDIYWVRKVIFKVTLSPNKSKNLLSNNGEISVSSDGTTVTVDNVNAMSVSIWLNSDGAIQINSVTVYFGDVVLTYTKVEAKPATLTENGNIEYYTCTNDRYYVLIDGQYYELEENSWIIPATGLKKEYIETNKEQEYYDANFVEITCDRKGWDSGIYINNDFSMVITAKSDNKIFKVIYYVGENPNYSVYAYTDKGDIEVLDFGNEIVVTNINDTSIMFKVTNESINVKAVEVYCLVSSDSSVTYTKVEAKPVTTTEDGNIEYYIGSDEKYYILVEGEYKEISERTMFISIVTKVDEKAPTITQNGNKEYYLGSNGKYYNLVDDTYYEIIDNSWVITIERKVEAQPATENENGNIEYYIGSNGKYYVIKGDEYIEVSINDITIHSSHDGVVLIKVEGVEATCETTGNITYYYCSSCNKYFRDENGKNEIRLEQTIVPALGHDYGTVVTNPTCTKQGYTTYTCSHCHDSYVDSYVEALGHDWSDWVVTKEATETETGLKTRTCSRCGETETEVIPVLGHTHKLVKINRLDATCETAGNIEFYYCSECNKYFSDENAENEIMLEQTIINALGHDLVHHEFIMPTCTEVGCDDYDTCSRCDYTTYSEMNALGHDWSDWVVTKEATETETGLKTRTCSRCGETETEVIPVLVHTHNYNSVITAPTCTEQGYTTYTCDCGDTYVDNYTDALGHDYKAVVTEPTCTEEGFTTYTCSRCGHSYVDNYTETLGHDYKAVVTEPTCTEQGYTTHTCSRCQDSYVDSYVDALDHDWSDWVVTKEATETETGLKTRTCSRCGETETEVIPVLGHTHNLTKVDAVQATCETAGNIAYWYCESCGKYYNDENAENEITLESTVTPALGHDLVHHDAQEATCSEIGWEEYDTCSRCDYTTYKEIEALGHKSGEAVVENNVEATCETAGHYDEVVYCEHCGVELSRTTNYVDALGHNYEEEVTEPTCKTAGYTTYTCSRCHNSYIGNYVDALGHNYEEEVTAPTCKTAGYTTYTCSECNYSYVGNFVSALGHSFDEWIVKTPATCQKAGEEIRECSICHHSETRVVTAHHDYEEEVTAPTCIEGGYTTKTCSVCGHSEKYDYVDALGHDYKEEVIVPTCETAGYTTHTCSRCGDSYVDSYVDALGHKFGDWEVTKEATCKEHGTETRQCSTCGHVETREIIVEHKFTESVTAPTCEERGYTTYTCEDCGYSYISNYVGSLGHKYEMTINGATCLEGGYTTYTCSVCGHSYEAYHVDALGHHYVAKVTEPTCTEEGFTTYTCSRCGDTYVDTYVETLGHDYVEVVTAPTCEEQGYTTHTCSRCEHTYVDTYVEALGHDYIDEVTEPTCLEGGYTTHTCSRCEDSYVDSHTDALGHDYFEEVTAPTCEESGYTTHTCSRCGYSYVDSHTDALGHEFSTWEIVINPTCEEVGEETRECSVCHKTETRTIDALGHDYVEEVTAPTCLEGGYTTHTCSRCEDSYVDSHTDALGHDYVEEVTAPTCETAGYTTHTCSRCGDSYVDSHTDALGHDFGEWVVTKPAEPGVKGEEQRTCSRCEEIETREIPALPYEPTINEETGEKQFNETVTQDEPKDVTNLFTQAKEEEGSVEIKAGELTLVFDNDAVNAIGANENVQLTATVLTEDTGVEDAELVLEITLEGATFADGKATLSIPFETEVPEGKVAKVYYIDKDGNRTDMNATFENGKVTFTTNHFSTYAVVFEDAPKSNAGLIIAIVLMSVAVLGIAGFAVYHFGFHNKKKTAKTAENTAE